MATAIVVDEIGDIVEVPVGSMEPPISGIDREQAQFVAGSVFVSDRMVGLLNVDTGAPADRLVRHVRGSGLPSGKGGTR